MCAPDAGGGDSDYLILLESRILTVADIVESMSEDRPYRKSLGMELAVQEIKRLSGNRLDPDVVEARSASGADRSTGSASA